MAYTEVCRVLIVKEVVPTEVQSWPKSLSAGAFQTVMLSAVSESGPGRKYQV